MKQGELVGLRPCPFCGSGDVYICGDDNFVSCPSCSAYGPNGAQAWNTRSGLAELEEANRVLREALPDQGSITLLLALVDAEIEREGPTHSFMVNASRLLELLTFATKARAALTPSGEQPS